MVSNSFLFTPALLRTYIQRQRIVHWDRCRSCGVTAQTRGSTTFSVMPVVSRHGADPRVPDLGGATAFHCAMDSGPS